MSSQPSYTFKYNKINCYDSGLNYLGGYLVSKPCILAINCTESSSSYLDVIGGVCTDYPDTAKYTSYVECDNYYNVCYTASDCNAGSFMFCH